MVGTVAGVVVTGGGTFTGAVTDVGAVVGPTGVCVCEFKGGVKKGIGVGGTNAVGVEDAASVGDDIDDRVADRPGSDCVGVGANVGVAVGVNEPKAGCVGDALVVVVAVGEVLWKASGRPGAEASRTVAKLRPMAVARNAMAMATSAHLGGSESKPSRSTSLARKRDISPATSPTLDPGRPVRRRIPILARLSWHSTSKSGRLCGNRDRA